MCNLVYEDSVSSKEKQQITLRNFLKSKSVNHTTSPSKDKESFICPICSEEYKTDFSVFNDHVKNCMSNQFLDEVEKVEESSTKATSLNKCELKEPYSENDGNSSKSDDESLKYFCPVCELNPCVKNLIELNAHIDNCLNKVAIKEILADDSQTTNKRKQVNLQRENFKKVKGSRKEKKIEEYFQ